MSASRGCAPKEWPFDGAAVQNMHRVSDPDERKKLQAKSRRIFLRIAAASTLLFLGGLVATVMLLPKLAQIEDGGKGPCPTALDANATDATVVCHGHGYCEEDRSHSHCRCWMSMYEGVSCETLSLGFLLGAPTAIAAVLWLFNLAWILRGGDQTQPPPTAQEMSNIYDELTGILVRSPPPLEPSGTPSTLRDDPEKAVIRTSDATKTTQRRPQTFALSKLWSHGLGAVVVLVRRPG